MIARVPSRATARKSNNGPNQEPNYRALAELRHQIRKFLMFSEQAARISGIEPQQHQVLLAIKGLPEGLRPTIGVLADRLQLRHHTVVGLIDRLAAAKLACRAASAADGREILVHITQRGEKLLRDLSLAHHTELENAAPALVHALQTIVRKAPARRAAASRQSS